VLRTEARRSRAVVPSRTRPARWMGPSLRKSANFLLGRRVEHNRAVAANGRLYLTGWGNGAMQGAYSASPAAQTSSADVHLLI